MENMKNTHLSNVMVDEADRLYGGVNQDLTLEEQGARIAQYNGFYKGYNQACGIKTPKLRWHSRAERKKYKDVFGKAIETGKKAKENHEKVLGHLFYIHRNNPEQLPTGLITVIESNDF